MNIDCICRHLKPEPTIVDFAKRRAGLALGRFANRIDSLVLRIDDVNGPRGGLDISCLGTATLHGGETVVITARHTSAQGAVIEVMTRLRQAVIRTLERARIGH